MYHQEFLLNKTKPSYAFTSDNTAPAHPRLLEAMIAANTGYQKPYDNDEYGTRARDAFKNHFGPEVQTFFVLNGTGANVTSLMSTLAHYESVLCTADAHINTDECGATERILGCKLIVVPSINGKMQLEHLDSFLEHQGSEHRAQVRMLSLTQATEFGTIYSMAEIQALCAWAHKNNILVHMDGARLANAVVTLGGNLRATTLDLGVDIISFGATKNGLAFGEAVIFKNAELAKHFLFSRKQGTQLLSKSRYISSQFIPYLEENIWQKNAAHANHCAQQIVDALSRIDIVPIYPVEANEIFVEISSEHLKQIQATFFIYPWTTLPNNKVIARIVTSWANTAEEVQEFIACFTTKG